VPPSNEPDFWPKEIALKVVSPKVNLTAAATQLQARTKGVLAADIFEEAGRSSGEVTLKFTIRAVPIGYREDVLFVHHGQQQVYPAQIEAACFFYDGSFHNDSRVKETMYSASDQDDFVRGLTMALHSVETTSLLQSLVARMNELRPQSGPNA